MNRVRYYRDVADCWSPLDIFSFLIHFSNKPLPVSSKTQVCPITDYISQLPLQQSVAMWVAKRYKQKWYVHFCFTFSEMKIFDLYIHSFLFPFPCVGVHMYLTMQMRGFPRSLWSHKMKGTSVPKVSHGAELPHPERTERERNFYTF